VHTWWPTTNVDRYCVATGHAREALVERGVPADDVHVTGIPVRPQFSERTERSEARRSLELPADAFVVLVVAGASIKAPYARIAGMLGEIVDGTAAVPGVVPIVVTGSDEKLARSMMAHVEERGLEHVRVLGFVKDMAQLMSAADMVLTKPGGLICAESLAMGLPLVLVGPSYGQERANAEILTEVGAAVALDPDRIREQIAGLAGDGPDLEVMRERSEAFGRPTATTTVAELVAGLL
jgi:processive 1,2-diacylglycerol beta-glucosyltransferase